MEQLTLSCCCPLWSGFSQVFGATLIPQLLENSTLSLWSAGCSAECARTPHGWLLSVLDRHTGLFPRRTGITFPPHMLSLNFGHI